MKLARPLTRVLSKLFSCPYCGNINTHADDCPKYNLGFLPNGAFIGYLMIIKPRCRKCGDRLVAMPPRATEDLFHDGNRYRCPNGCDSKFYEFLKGVRT